MECIHGYDELTHWRICSDTSVVEFLFSDSAQHLSSIVMSRVYERLIWKCIYLLHDRMIEFLWRASLEVCTSSLADEERVTCEYHIVHEV
jgi:hypothetical protein